MPVQSKHTQNINAVIGFGCSLGFLAFVSKFNSVVQAMKAKKMGRKGATVDMDFMQKLRVIFGQTCGSREIVTVGSLALCLLLRTLGSVWVARHWGRIVSSLVTRNFGLMSQHIRTFGVVTVGLAVLNALLKYYVSLLKEEVPRRSRCGVTRSTCGRRT